MAEAHKSPPQPRVRDGFRDALAEIVTLCDDGALEQRQARHSGGNTTANLMHASMDAETLLKRISDRARRLQR